MMIYALHKVWDGLEFLKKYAYQNQNRYLIGVTYVIHIDNRIINLMGQDFIF